MYIFFQRKTTRGEGIPVKRGPDDGGWRMADGGQKNADDRMRLKKCGWKNADDKMWMVKWKNTDGQLSITLCR